MLWCRKWFSRICWDSSWRRKIPRPARNREQATADYAYCIRLRHCTSFPNWCEAILYAIISSRNISACKLWAAISSYSCRRCHKPFFLRQVSFFELLFLKQCCFHDKLSRLIHIIEAFIPRIKNSHGLFFYYAFRSHMKHSGAKFPSWPCIRGPKASSSMNLHEYIASADTTAGDKRSAQRVNIIYHCLLLSVITVVLLVL